MKKIVLFLIVVIISVHSSFSQKREDKKILSFESRSKQLTNATGWVQNKLTGKWISNKNVIDDKKTNKISISHRPQNFTSIQFCKIIDDDKTHYILSYIKASGEYKYPSIYEDWESESRNYFFVVDSVQYSKIKSEVDLKSGKNIYIKSKIYGYITDRFKILGGEHAYTEKNLLAKITNTLKNQRYTEDCFVLNYQTIDGLDVVRFRLPEGCKYNKTKISTRYFEVNTKEFKKIFLE